MSLTEAKKYITELHKKQENPYLWPDFLTGLPGKNAIIKKLDEVFSDLGRFSVAYVRIANVHPYLIKYGPDRHAEIIQWAAAVLKTTCATCKNCFVGTVSTHDFIIICDTKNMVPHMKKAAKLFQKKMEAYYSPEDLKKKTTLSFRKNGQMVNIGLMKLTTVVVSSKPRISKNLLIRHMGTVCEELERTSEDISVLDQRTLVSP